MFIFQIDAKYIVCLSAIVIGDCVKDFCDFSMQIDCSMLLVFPLHNSVCGLGRPLNYKLVTW